MRVQLVSKISLHRNVFMQWRPRFDFIIWLPACNQIKKNIIIINIKQDEFSRSTVLVSQACVRDISPPATVFQNPTFSTVIHLNP